MIILFDFLILRNGVIESMTTDNYLKNFFFVN